jgi:hypothetical protein
MRLDTQFQQPTWATANIVTTISPNPYIFLFRGQFYTDSSMVQTSRGDDLVWARARSETLSSVAAICSVTVVELEFAYQNYNKSYSIKSIGPSSNNATIRAVTVVLDASQPPWQNTIPSLQAAALRSTSTSDTSFLKEIARSYIEGYLPFAHSAFTPVPATTVDINSIVEGSLVPTPWLLTYLALLLLFGLLAVLQGVLALGASSEAVWRPNIAPKKNQSGTSRGSRVNIVQLAADRLTSPIGLIYELFERSNNDERDVARSLQDSNITMFKESGGMNGRGREIRIGTGLKVDSVERFGFVVAHT